MNRSELQTTMIKQIVDDMDMKTMEAILRDYMSESYDKYSEAELLEEVKEYYPHILEEVTQTESGRTNQLGRWHSANPKPCHPVFIIGT